MNFTYAKLNECYKDNVCDYKTNDCLAAACKFSDIKIPEGFDDYDSEYTAYRNITKYGGLVKGFYDVGLIEIPQNRAKRGDWVLRGKVTVGIYVGNRKVRFINGFLPLEKDDRIFTKENK